MLSQNLASEVTHQGEQHERAEACENRCDGETARRLDAATLRPAVCLGGTGKARHVGLAAAVNRAARLAGTSLHSTHALTEKDNVDYEALEVVARLPHADFGPVEGRGRSRRFGDPANKWPSMPVSCFRVR